MRFRICGQWSLDNSPCGKRAGPVSSRVPKGGNVPGQSNYLQIRGEGVSLRRSAGKQTATLFL